ncbi:trimeric LpxA-like protein [Aureobasidium sp. EXF-8845]|nr:trimeric LpxA-like protein [Aureobasidium sp. EXF-8846]KAI4803522.1 trimeric LpxA-like protein [Aureobasidium sp. EXF-8845]
MPGTENKARSLRGELYHAFTPELVAERRRCARACNTYNKAESISRRRQVELWKEFKYSIIGDTTPLPPRKEGSTEDEDEELLASEAWVEAPFHADYGTNVRLGEGVFINFDCTIIDTCLVSIGSRTLLAPNVSLYSGTHPLDPDLRNGTNGPESGKPITIEEDVWIGGNVTVCPGVTIGRGSTVGAGSVVTKVSWIQSVCSQCPQSNPAKVIKQAPRNTTTSEERAEIRKIADGA